MRRYAFGVLIFAVCSHAALAAVSKSAVVLVKDSTGKVVGPYISAPNPYIGNNGPEDNVLIRTATRSFAVHLTSTILGQSDTTIAYFSNSNCTGTAYLTYAFPYEIGMPTLPFASVVGTTAYIGGNTHGGNTAFSRRYVSGAQVVCEQGSYSGNYVTVVATFNMANLALTPPFKVY
jgi:hypothetical protein